jgi:hypothetical protein
MTIRISLVTVLAALAFVTIGAAGAAGVMLWEPWDGDGNSAEESPTSAPEPASAPTGPRLTGAEAAGKASAEVRSTILETGRSDLSLTCDAEDFNDRTGMWIVYCLVVGPGNALEFRFKVNDFTGQVSLVE